jgi:hypothetical protein
MPTLAIFYGIAIQMFWYDHPPPHFPASYQGQEAQIDIWRAQLLNGSLPPRILAMVVEWTRENQAALLQAWEECSNGRIPRRIRPLA